MLSFPLLLLVEATSAAELMQVARGSVLATCLLTASVQLSVPGSCHRIHGVGSVALARLGAIAVVTAALLGQLAHFCVFGPELGVAGKALARGLLGEQPLEPAWLTPDGPGPAGLLGAWILQWPGHWLQGALLQGWIHGAGSVVLAPVGAMLVVTVALPGPLAHWWPLQRLLAHWVQGSCRLVRAQMLAQLSARLLAALLAPLAPLLAPLLARLLAPLLALLLARLCHSKNPCCARE